VSATLIGGEEKVEPILHACYNDVINNESEQHSTTYYARPFPTTLIDLEDIFCPTYLLDQVKMDNKAILALLSSLKIIHLSSMISQQG
jgi:hypothetical protein